MKKIILPFLMVAFALITRAKSIDVKWSEQYTFDNKQDGFFDQFIGSNNTYIYGKFSNLASLPKKQNKKIKLVAFDKVTMKKVGEAPLRGYGKGDKDDYDYYKTITLNNLIYVFWTNVDKRKDVLELYVETFDPKLKKINKLKKVYEINSGSKALGTDKLILIYNQTLNDKILLAKEFSAKENENLKIEYKLLNPDFSFVTSKQVTLPIMVTKKRKGLFSSAEYSSCSYELADDGNLYVQESIKITGDEKKQLKKGEASVYPHIMQIVMETGSLKEYHLKFPKKNTFNFSSLITKNGVRLYGFFSDLDKDEKGSDSHGIFYITLDSKSFQVKDTKFSYFDKPFLDQLYAADKENQKKGRGLFKSDKAKASDDESLDDNYVIEEVIEDGNDILLFCSIMNNWSRTVCTTDSRGSRTCQTYYYCTKSNVTSFRLSGSGDILWAKNLDRSITYSRWNVYDLNVMRKESSYYVVYGSSYQINAKKKNRKGAKSGKQLTDRFEYAVFSGQTGDYKKAEHQINSVNAKKADKKFISADNIQVYDNKMYTDCVKTKIKPLTWLSCLCPPVFYFVFLSGNSRKGTGYFGTIAPLK